MKETMKSISPTFITDTPLPAPRKVFGVFLLALFAFAPPAFTACEQVLIPAFHFSSWDSHGRQNRVRINETSYPDSLVGWGPNFDWYFGSESLQVSDNVLAFEVPPFTGTVVSAELRLRLRYLMSFRGTETYQWHRVTNLVVMQQLRRTLGPNLHLDFNLGAVYGAGTISISEPSVTIPPNDKFIETVTAAAGKNLLMGGSLASADSDPFLEQYWYLETAGSSDYATLVLTYATTNSPQIVTQPVSRTVNAGTDVDFSVAVCGARPLSYQWRFDGANLEAGTNRVLLLAGADMAQAGEYTVTAGNAMGVVTSAVATLEVVRLPPFLALEPTSTTVAAGDTNLYFRALPSGAPMPAYQWRLNGLALPGATNNILWFSPVTPVNAGSYTVVAINSSGSVTSSPAILSVVPFFLDGPQDTSLLVGNEVQIESEASGVILPSICRWFHDGIELAGTNGCALGFTATPADAGDYWVIASNQYGSVTSRVARISVVEAAPLFIRKLDPGTNTFIAGLSNQMIVATEAGPPANYFWYHDEALIPGEHTPILNFATVSPADAGQYLVIASNRIGQATSGPGSLAVVSAQVSVSPEQNEVEAGGTATMWAQYVGVPEVAFQWRFNGVDLSGKTNKFLVLRNLSTSHSGLYSVVATNPFGSRESEPAGLEVMLYGPLTLALPAEVSARTGDFVWIVSSLFRASTTCQWQFNGVNIPGATNRVLALSNVTAEDSGVYSMTASNLLGAASYGSVSNTVLTVSAPEPFDNWHSLNPQPQANSLHAMAHGNGRRVAVGENGAVLLSTNGQTWTARHLGKGIHLRAISFGNGMCVAAGYADVFTSLREYRYWRFELPVIFTSPDGLVWHACNLDVAGRVTSVAFGSNRFVAVGTLGEWYLGGGVALTSQDGITWEKVEWSAAAGFASWAAICFDNDRFVAVSDGSSALVPRNTI